MKFYSELTKGFYDTQEQCVEAERKHKEKIESKKKKDEELARVRTERLSEIFEAKKAAKEATNKYYKLVSDFEKDYPYSYKTLLEINYPYVFDLNLR